MPSRICELIGISSDISAVEQIFRISEVHLGKWNEKLNKIFRWLDGLSGDI